MVDPKPATTKTTKPATTKTTKPAVSKVYRPVQVFRRKNPATGQWTLFKPVNGYKLADIKWLDDYQSLFHAEPE